MKTWEKSWGLHANVPSTLIGLSSVVTNEPVDFEKQLVKAQNLRKLTNHSRGIYKNIPKVIIEKSKDVNM